MWCNINVLRVAIPNVLDGAQVGNVEMIMCFDILTVCTTELLYKKGLTLMNYR